MLSKCGHKTCVMRQTNEGTHGSAEETTSCFTDAIKLYVFPDLWRPLTSVDDLLPVS